MQQKYYWIIGIAILGIIVISLYVQQKAPITSTFQTNTCEQLAKNLDEKIIDTNNPPGDFIIGDFEGIVGGTIIKISEPSYEENIVLRRYLTYTITFIGVNKVGDLFLRTKSETTLPYKVDQFYKFDLKNKNKYSAELSGVFIDTELNALEHLQECD